MKRMNIFNQLNISNLFLNGKISVDVRRMIEETFREKNTCFAMLDSYKANMACHCNKSCALTPMVEGFFAKIVYSF